MTFETPTVGNPLVVYVCSGARCGSTVLDMFLGAHPDIASLGELNMLGKALRMDRPCSCGQLVKECPAWTSVFARYKHDDGLDLIAEPYGLHLWEARAKFFVDRQHQTPRYERRFRVKSAWLRLRRALPAAVGELLPLPPGYEQMLRNKMQLYSRISVTWGKKVVVDSSKNAMEAIELARRWPMRVKVVLLTRDGRGVYLSHRTTGLERRESLSGWAGYYRRYAPLIRRFIAPANLVCLRYEDFARDPDGVGRRLCSELRVPFSSEMPSLGGDQRHLVDGNRTRLFPGRGVRLDERWRTELEAEELAYFESHAGNLNRQLGYA
mgnify:CR=1 FL=1